jgi:hypothetical protein
MSHERGRATEIIAIEEKVTEAITTRHDRSTLEFRHAPDKTQPHTQLAERVPRDVPSEDDR